MRYLKNIKTGVVMPHTPLLAKNRPDLLECDAQGNTVSPGVNSDGAPLLLNPITGTVVPATDALRHVKGLIGVYSVEEATAILEQLNTMDAPSHGAPVGLRRDPVKFDLDAMTPDVSANLSIKDKAPDLSPAVTPGPEEDGSGEVGGQDERPYTEDEVRAMKYQDLQKLAKSLDLNAGEKKEIMVEQVLVALQQVEVV